MIGDALVLLVQQRDDALIARRAAEATLAEIAKILGAPDDADLVAFARARMQEVARAEHVLREYGPAVSLQEFTRQPLYSTREAMREAGLPGWEHGSGMSSADAIRELARQRDAARRQCKAPSSCAHGGVYRGERCSCGVVVGDSWLTIDQMASQWGVHPDVVDFYVNELGLRAGKTYSPDAQALLYREWRSRGCPT